jgi:hypothetical protein
MDLFILKNIKFICTKKIFLHLPILEEMTSYVLNHKGEEVISERHQKILKGICGRDKRYS